MISTPDQRLTLCSNRCAREYVSQESNDRGHKLLGDILRAQGKRDDALAEYEKSLQLNPVQEDVLSLVSDLITPDITNCDRLAVIRNPVHFGSDSCFLSYGLHEQRNQAFWRSRTSSGAVWMLRNRRPFRPIPNSIVY